MKKFFSQNSFHKNLFTKNSLQKILLLLVLLLTFSGCELDFRDKYVFSSSSITDRKFIEYFKNNTTYDGYEYILSNQTLTKDGYTYTYNDDGDMDKRTGTFSYGIVILKADIDNEGKITVSASTTKYFIEYFDGTTNYDGYMYIPNAQSLESMIDLFKYYKYQDDGDDGDMQGTFVNGTTTLTATLHPDGSINISMDSAEYLAYFANGMTYNEYFKYYLNSDGTPYILYNNEKYYYQNNGSMSTRKGTFGKLVDGFGIVLTATIAADGTVTVEITQNVQRTFLDYFGNNEQYRGNSPKIYTYSATGKSLTADGVVYTYQNDGDDMIGTFKNDIYIVTAQVVDGNVVILSEPFINYFEDNNSYSGCSPKIYTYSATGKSLTADGVVYTYQNDGDDMTGTFKNDIYIVTVQVVDNDVIILSEPFINYFEDGKSYSGYLYRASDKSLYYNYKYHTYNPKSSTTTGTFGQLVEGYGVLLTGTVDSGDVTVKVTTDNNTIAFSYKNVSYEYTITDSKVTLADGSGEFAAKTDGTDTYYYSRVNGTSTYFKVDANRDIFGVETTDRFDVFDCFYRRDSLNYTNLEGRLGFYYEYESFTGGNIGHYSDTNLSGHVSRDVHVYGSISGNNTVSGSGDDSLTVYGSGSVYVYGDVYGDVSVYGSVSGSGDGTRSGKFQYASSSRHNTVDIYGDVYGDIKIFSGASAMGAWTDSFGSYGVSGTVYLTKYGNTTVNVYGNLYGSITVDSRISVYDPSEKITSFAYDLADHINVNVYGSSSSSDMSVKDEPNVRDAIVQSFSRDIREYSYNKGVDVNYIQNNFLDIAKNMSFYKLN